MQYLCIYFDVGCVFNFWGIGTVGHFRVFLVLDLDSWTLFWWHIWFSWFVRIHGV